jgi:denticleless
VNFFYELLLGVFSPYFNESLIVSTRPILQSFVSSLKTDIYACQSINTNTFLTPPYTCAYTHGQSPLSYHIEPSSFHFSAAKSGGLPLLAVATEEGTVQIINTSKRKPWDPGKYIGQSLNAHT